jgi:TonB family protein
MHRIHVFLLVLVVANGWITRVVAQAGSSDTPFGKIGVVALETPVYPPMARVANISGDVSVTVTLRSDGAVESAAVVKGHPMLRQVALDSARQTHFECRGCSTGTVSYQMLYTFRIVEGADCCHARSVAPKIESRTQSDTSSQDRQTQVIVTAEQSCLCDPAVTRVDTIRSPKCLYLWKCSKIRVHVTE